MTEFEEIMADLMRDEQYDTARDYQLDNNTDPNDWTSQEEIDV